MDRPRLLGPARAADVLRAVLELARARLTVDSRQASRAAAEEPRATRLSQRQQEVVERVAFTVPRVAVRMPFRADCLVQAMAARRWLASAGIPARLVLGVPRDKPATFEAHAWLSVGDRIVTGGDVSGYAPLVRRQATDAS